MTAIAFAILMVHSPSSNQVSSVRLLTKATVGPADVLVLPVEKGDDYVRITVILATVLLLTALSQRFTIASARKGLLAVACLMLGIALFLIAMSPRA